MAYLDAGDSPLSQRWQRKPSHRKPALPPASGKLVGCVNGVYNFQALHSFFCGLPAASAAVLADPRGQFGTGRAGRAGRGLPHLADAGATGGQGARRDLDLVPDQREGARPRDQGGGGDLPGLPPRHGLRRGGLGGHRHRPAALALGPLPDDCTPPPGASRGRSGSPAWRSSSGPCRRDGRARRRRTRSW